MRVPMRWLALVLVALVLASCTGVEEQQTPPSRTRPDITIGATTSPDVVVAPNLIGLPVEEARELVSKLGLRLGDVQVVTGTYTDAAIIEQHPRAATEIEPGTAINVVSGPAE